MALQSTSPVAIGLGCRKGCDEAELVALVRATLGDLPAGAVPFGLFTIETKRGEPGLLAAAATLGLPLVFFDEPALQPFVAEARTHSSRIAAMHGLPSVAETAALAGAGPGATLLVPRRATARATCAIAGAREKRG